MSLEFLLNKKYRMKTYLLPTMCACVRVCVFVELCNEKVNRILATNFANEIRFQFLF